MTYSSNLALVFELLSAKKEQNVIENYSVTQTTLEQIFVRLAGHDITDDDNLHEVASEASEPSSQTGIVELCECIIKVAFILSYSNQFFLLPYWNPIKRIWPFCLIDYIKHKNQ